VDPADGSAAAEDGPDGFRAGAAVGAIPAGGSPAGTRRVRIVGPGRAGGSLAGALAGAGWAAEALRLRGDDLRDAAAGVDLLVLAVPDGVVAAVASLVEPVAGTVVAHLAGSLGLDVLAPHSRRATVHPLVALPDPVTGAKRLAAGGAWFALAADGDPLAAEVVTALAGRSFTVADADRAAYHAAACIASNHLVALLGQAERVAAQAGVPLAPYFDLVRATVDNVVTLGPVAALTGPAARGDEATLDRHRAVLAPGEHRAYEAMVAECRRLAAERSGGAT
jgi:predicted short-subunit dehydrogenase-like oxidoreductase (DUF2520 family)